MDSKINKVLRCHFGSSLKTLEFFFCLLCFLDCRCKHLTWTTTFVSNLDDVHVPSHGGDVWAGTVLFGTLAPNSCRPPGQAVLAL